MMKVKIEPGYEHVNVHMIFDIDMDGKFTRKSRLMVDGHTTAPPSPITYSSVVSRESVRIEFLPVSLNDLDMLVVGNFNTNLAASEGQEQDEGVTAAMAEEGL